jgi:hypothetical protein
MLELGSSGSARGVCSNAHPYRDPPWMGSSDCGTENGRSPAHPRRCQPPQRRSHDRTHSGRSPRQQEPLTFAGALDEPAGRGQRSPFRRRSACDLHSRQRHRYTTASTCQMLYAPPAQISASQGSRLRSLSRTNPAPIYFSSMIVTVGFLPAFGSTLIRRAASRTARPRRFASRSTPNSASCLFRAGLQTPYSSWRHR